MELYVVEMCRGSCALFGGQKYSNRQETANKVGKSLRLSRFGLTEKRVPLCGELEGKMIFVGPA